MKAAEAFFLAYLAMPILLALWIGVYIWKRTLPKALKDIDLDVSFAELLRLLLAISPSRMAELDTRFGWLIQPHLSTHPDRSQVVAHRRGDAPRESTFLGDAPAPSTALPLKRELT